MSDILVHHGIKGQRWGVRRYQNPDGSLTSEGEKRYYDSDGGFNKFSAYGGGKRELTSDIRRQHRRELHERKIKKADEPNVRYHTIHEESDAIDKGKNIIKKSLNKWIEIWSRLLLKIKMEAYQKVGKPAKDWL